MARRTSSTSWRPGQLRHPVLVSLLAIAASVLPVFLTGALSVQLRASLSFGTATLGLLVAVFFLAAVAGSLVAGPIAERWRAGTVLRCATATSATCLAAVALAVHSPIALAVVLAFAGVANGVLQPSVNAYLVHAVRPGRQGLAFGLRQSAIPLSTLLGGLAVPALALTVGWRFAYGAASLLAVGAVALLPPPSTTPPPERRSGAANAGRVALAPLAVLALGAGLGAGAANALGSFLVPGAVAAHVPAGLAGGLAAGGSCCGMASRIAVGARADRRDGGHLRVVAAMLALGAGGYLLLATGRPLLLVPGTALAFAAGWGWNGLLNFAVARSHPRAPARATAITQAGVFAGSVAVPIAFGLLVGHTSYRAGWLLAAGLVLAAAAVVAVGRRLLAAAVSPAEVTAPASRP
ncbi:MAG: MFS transporter [Actinomycetota bacterium]|nr:MFS transporter [Actinomycetota bacterium]